MTIGTVESVDRENRTCDVERDGQPTLFKCRLNAVIDTLGSYVAAIPRVGSYVLCLTLDDPANCLVIAMSEPDEVAVKINNTTAVITSDDITLNGGALGGLVKVSELTAKLNELVTTFNLHTHAVAGTTASPTPNQAASFSRGDYENLKVKQ
ncbi:hypothetical protein [Dysgonomonas termitidis]|uniref:Uncharacterized protein n=1 Tax=Dysgonomonas termitidis TaxID=1516126 RepID=A0ABV9KVG0_9BACT